MNFAETERYLLSLGNEVSAMKLGLKSVSRLLSALGDPHKRSFKVQVAGTNGKGSVCAFLDAMCVAAGVRTGLFTSPHLVSMRERIRINGGDIGESEFASLATFVRDTSEMLVELGSLTTVPTFFEQVTAIALIAFANHGVDIAILETGLGGRLDATTAAGAEVCGITQIALDHQEYLGDTIQEIAAEKAAIIHSGSQTVIAEQSPEAMTVILDRCEDVGVEPVFARDVAVSAGGNRSGSECADSEALTFHTAKDIYTARLSLAGAHQIANAKVAILLAELLQERFPQITREHIIKGLADARHPGRLEWVGNVLLDGAHNIAGAQALAIYLSECVTQPLTIVFAAMQGKDIGGIAEILFGRAEHVILTQPTNSRSVEPKDLLSAVSAKDGPTDLLLEPSVSRAVERAKQLAGDQGLVLITGSLYLVGEARKILNN